MKLLKIFLSAVLALGLLLPSMAQSAYAQTLGPVPGNGTPLDNRLYTATTTLRQVSNRARHASSLQALSSGMGRIWEANSVSVSAMSVCFTNWAANQSTGVETGPGGTTTVAISVEYPSGTFKQLLWGGASTKAITTATTECSDLTDLGYTIPANERYWLRIYAANSGGSLPSNAWATVGDLTRGDAFVFNGTNQTMSGTVADNASGNFMLYPAAVLAQSNRKVWATVGDSISAGVQDTIPDASGGQGWFGRALARQGPVLNMGSPGDRMVWFNSNSTLRRALIATAGVTNIINAYGINDFDAGATSAATLASARETFRGLFTGIPVFDTTVQPKSGSTDSWATVTNQTVWDATKNTQRVAYNNLQRAGLANSAGLIDVAMWVETSTASPIGPIKDGGIWIPLYMYGGDGTHPISRGYDEISRLMSSLLAVQTK